MAGRIAVGTYRKGFLAVLETVVERSQGSFLEREAALFGTLASVSAEEASRRVGAHGTTLAAQVAHVRVYIAARNDQIRIGEERPIDRAVAWLDRDGDGRRVAGAGRGFTSRIRTATLLRQHRRRVG